jgi:hypothetical protein
MAARLSLVILVACLVAAPDVAVAQIPGGDVTLKVPLNLTKLSTDLVKVRVFCGLQSAAIKAITAEGRETNYISVLIDAPVSNGQVVTTLTFVFSKFTLVNPSGITASYRCNLAGIDKAGQAALLTATHDLPQFRVTPTADDLTGTFTW